MILQNIGILPHNYMCHNPEDHNLDLQFCENLKSCIVNYVYVDSSYSQLTLTWCKGTKCLPNTATTNLEIACDIEWYK